MDFSSCTKDDDEETKKMYFFYVDYDLEFLFNSGIYSHIQGDGILITTSIHYDGFVFSST